MKKQEFDEKDLLNIFNKLKKNNCFDLYMKIVHRIEKYFLLEFIEDNSFKTNDLLNVIIAFFNYDFPGEDIIKKVNNCLTDNEFKLLCTSVWLFEESELIKNNYKMI